MMHRPTSLFMAVPSTYRDGMTAGLKKCRVHEIITLLLMRQELPRRGHYSIDNPSIRNHYFACSRPLSPGDSRAPADDSAASIVLYGRQSRATTNFDETLAWASNENRAIVCKPIYNAAVSRCFALPSAASFIRCLSFLSAICRYRSIAVIDASK